MLNLPVAAIYSWIISNAIILHSSVYSELPYRILFRDGRNPFCLSLFNIWFRSIKNKGQSRRKCLLFSLKWPHKQSGLSTTCIWENKWSLSGLHNILNLAWLIDKIRDPVKYHFGETSGGVFSFLVNVSKVSDAFTSLSKLFQSCIVLGMKEFWNDEVLTPISGKLCSFRKTYLSFAPSGGGNEFCK